MDLATLLGMLGASGVIIGAIALGGDVMLFINVPSLLIVIGGTAFAVMFRATMGQFIGSFKVAMGAFFSKNVPPQTLIEEAVELANVARKEGILALEGREISHPFLETGIGMCIDGHPPEVVQKVLSKDINLTIQRQEAGYSIFKATGDVAPAMGMIGTLIGLVQMLANMDDPKAIGPAMAVALLTTLYGAVIANAFAIPIAEKLKLRSVEEKLNKSLILESISGIQEGVNPRVLEQMLMTYLPESQRQSANKDG
ncbi:flagellar motor protein PomA [Marichromatium bheemlicum]|uniref:Flagellar motor protein PomA n=1 Tax=Marichromatium bheemlicum TaxID=365339 RepID=A0ABX1IEJ6_9GAMM|nr:flagellar motor protein PomA [Marichromatium bheemlicum]